MNHLKTVTGMFAAMALAVGTASAESRTWTATDGRTVEAEFKGVSGVNVLLNVAGRGTIPFPLSGLSEADRKWVEEQLKVAKPGTPEIETDGSSAFLGKWEGFMANSDGSPQGRLNLEITGELITATTPNGQVMGAGTYRIRGDQKLMRIDTKGTAGQYEGKSYEGIVSVEGKTLRWCSANDNPSAKRPTEFQTDVRQYHFLMVLEKK